MKQRKESLEKLEMREERREKTALSNLLKDESRRNAEINRMVKKEHGEGRKTNILLKEAREYQDKLYKAKGVTLDQVKQDKVVEIYYQKSRHTPKPQPAPNKAISRQKALNRLRDTAAILNLVKPDQIFHSYETVKRIFGIDVKTPQEVEKLNQKLKEVVIERNKKTFNDYVLKDEFLRGRNWRNLRKKVVKKLGHKCCKCGFNDQRDLSKYHVDHVIPRRVRPDLALDPNNLQVLCADCNIEKGNETVDYRADYERMLLSKIPQLSDHTKYLY